MDDSTHKREEERVGKKKRERKVRKLHENQTKIIIIIIRHQQ